ncbi:MAG TPA: mannose-1-phosphate guanylyltransferase [Syntrophomonadaceae bacterium]|nr:mannose-1-phosphate guanylyltransferase [Syntrophomonadaceae bacterium]
MISVILAGGRGLRLWPESRRAHPKQLCKFVADRTMLDHTIDRLVKAGAEKLMIITNDELRCEIEELVQNHPDADKIEILSEPEGKNTAPAVAMALAKCGLTDENAVLGIFPSDHHVLDEQGFIQTVEKACQAAEQNRIATIGVAPNRPETGYGYIEKSKWEVGEIPDIFGVDSFREKPDLDTARSYLDSGRYVWNSGIYVGKIQTLREEFARFLPEIFSELSGGYEHYLQSYSTLPDISLDYGIAEKSDRMAVVPGDFGWCDLGNWNALAEISDTDEARNVCMGNDVLALESRDCLVKQDGKPVVLFGVENLLVVETDNVVLVADRERTQDVRHLVELLQQKNRQDLL